MIEVRDSEFVYRLRREADGLKTRLRELWQLRWFRMTSYAALVFFIVFMVFWAIFVRDLPNAAALAEYEPPLPTMLRDANGEPIHSYARERRVELEYGDFPQPLVHAFLAAEDKTFFTHGGLDYPGIISAVISNISRDGRARGASTITQQVAKNILLTNEYSLSRKIKEAILAMRIEGALTKEQILTLYLNEIPLGRRSYGVEAAAQAYFDKDVGSLDLHETAFLAILPKAPETYSRSKNEQLAVTRRNWVLGEMRDNDWISEAEYKHAVAQPLGLVTQRATRQSPVGEYFVEEVRRRLIDRFGETEEDGPYSVYAGGLWVRSSMDPALQKATTDALRAGLRRYHRGRGYRGPMARLNPDKGDLASQLASARIGVDFEDWRAAVVTGRDGNVNIAFAGGKTGRLTAAPASLKIGDVIAVSPASGDAYNLETPPEVAGAMLVQDPHNGRVMAMQGGFDYRISNFNRATQAMRQPGSTIKPFVYATAIDQGLTPASIIVDGPFCVWQSATLGRKCFTNFGGSRGAGPRTMRWGLEQSRNLMTVRAANEAGMPQVVKTFKTMGIGEYPPYYSFALGAGETTVERMVNAYSMLINHGRELKPTVIDFVQDRKGNVVWPERWKPCEGCNMDDWDGKPMPRFKPTGKQLMDPVTAYQVVHMLEGVVERGTATVLRDLDRPLIGKTGTTSGPTNVWFIGGTPDLVAGVYLGYDTPRDMGSYAQGGSLAAPIFKQFAKQTLDGYPKTEFVAPAGTRMVRIDRRTGRRAFGGWPDGKPGSTVIWEAFKADTEPKRSIRQDEIDQAAAQRAAASRAAAARRAAEAEAASARQKAQAEAAERQNEFTEGGIY